MLIDDSDHDAVAHSTDPDLLAAYGLLVDPAVAAALLDIEDARLDALDELRLAPMTACHVIRTTSVPITSTISITRTAVIVTTRPRQGDRVINPPTNHTHNTK